MKLTGKSGISIEFGFEYTFEDEIKAVIFLEHNNHKMLIEGNALKSDKDSPNRQIGKLVALEKALRAAERFLHLDDIDLIRNSVCKIHTRMASYYKKLELDKYTKVTATSIQVY
jgi:hypothetical protein